MASVFSQTGLMAEHLFKVEGDLVENYNRALETAISKKTTLTAFHIDKRGESPEVEAELGRNYLQSGPAHRYCIVISPDQKDTRLIHEEFSFDNALLDFLYENYFSGISIATRVDALYGEINDNVREYDTLEDLLLIKQVELELHTPSGFLTRARELQTLVKQLRKNPNLLIKDESAVPARILELVRTVGDVRNYNLSPIRTTKELRSFYTRLFDGVFIYGDIVSEQPVHLRRPGQKEKRKPRKSAESSGPNTAVIYHQQVYQPEEGPQVKFIPLQNTADVIAFLLKYHYAHEDISRLEPALSRLEHETLLNQGHDITKLGKEQKTQLLYRHQHQMPDEWHHLRNIRLKMRKGYQPDEIIADCSVNARSMLLTPISYDKEDSYVTAHLLTKLYPYDYERMYHHNREDLQKIYNSAGKNKQKYIEHVISQGVKNGI